MRTILQSISTRIAVCVALLLAAAGPASASTIGISGTTLIFGADLNEQLAVSTFTSATDLFLEGAAPEIVTPGCVADGATGVRCALSGFSAFTIVGSNLDDAISLSQVVGLNAFVPACCWWIVTRLESSRSRLAIDRLRYARASDPLGLAIHLSRRVDRRPVAHVGAQFPSLVANLTAITVSTLVRSGNQSATHVRS